MASAPDVNNTKKFVKLFIKLLCIALIPSASEFHDSDQLSFWASDQCQEFKLCRDLVTGALKYQILRPWEWTQLGSLVQHLAEPFVKLTFRPESVFGENRLIYDNVDPWEILLYEILTNMTNEVFERSVDIPLHEIAMLFSPLDISLERQRAPTQREISSR